MNVGYLGILAIASAFAGNVLAEDGATLAQSHNCLTCHAVDHKKLGPAFKDVAAKYKDDKNAQATLEKKVRNGGGAETGAACRCLPLLGRSATRMSGISYSGCCHLNKAALQFTQKRPIYT